ncbi:MAG TPA: pitrilysin family protein, partial [Gemmatimonadaceae bacterium]|nr:pitrilysin family protein [Gemmatimonadaceae bacterium]
ANYLAEWEALGDWRLGSKYFDAVMATDAKKVQDVVSKYLTPDKAATLVYRPEKSPVVAATSADMRVLLESGARQPLAPIPFRTPSRPLRRERAAFDREESGVFIFRTRNGVPVLVRRKPGAAMAHVGLYIAGGCVEEPSALAGLTLLTARTMLKGTTTRTAAQIAEDSEMLGATISASAGNDSFGWAFSVPRARLGDALELLGDVVMHPTFPEDALETERVVALSNVEMLRDDMYRYPMKLAREAAFRGHPYGSPPMGSEQSLRAITRTHTEDWHRAHVLESAAVIGIVADVDATEAADIAANDLADLVARDTRTVSRPEWPVAVEVEAEAREKAQTALALAFPAPARTDDARFAASLIATVASGLGGRFFDELRDRRSLAYTVQAGFSDKRAAGMFISYIATSPEKEDIARDGLLAEFAKLRDVDVTAEEISRAKEYAIGTHAISKESGGAVLGQMLDAWMFGSLADIEEFDTRIRGVTARGMREVATRYFDESRRVEGIVRGVGRTV